MSVFLTKHKRAIIGFSVILCVLAMILTSRPENQPEIIENALGYVLVPVQKLFSGAAGRVSDFMGNRSDMEDLKRENEILVLEVERLRMENQRLRLVETEYIELREAMLFNERYPDYPKAGARVIAYDMGNWFNSFLIDMGERDGSLENMVVLASGGLVGRISKVRSTYSEVITIIDETSAVSAKGLRTEDTGIVKGDMSLMKEGLCRMERIALDAEIMEGDEIITSEMGDIYPEGVTIGYVLEVGTEARGLTKYAVIEPVVDFRRLRNVLIVTERFNYFLDTNDFFQDEPESPDG